VTPEITALDNQVRELKAKRSALYDCLATISKQADSISIDLDQIETEKGRLTLEAQSRQLAATGCIDGECG